MNTPLSPVVRSVLQKVGLSIERADIVARCTIMGAVLGVTGSTLVSLAEIRWTELPKSKHPWIKLFFSNIVLFGLLIGTVDGLGAYALLRMGRKPIFNTL